MNRQTRRAEASANATTVVRCAIYTRKSSEQGLGLDFNSLHAQRESGEAFIASQKGEGWVCLPEKYDDGGYSGGNTDRPAFQRLKQDIIAGKVDVVVIYKLDRLSRNARDFLAILDFLEEHRVGLASVTQSIQTTGAMGKFTLHIMVAVAQLERDHASERTRDKIAAARRKGKWAGGAPLLGYDVVSDKTGSRLVVNAAEAEQVRRIFALYLERGSLIEVAKALAELGWTTKRWTTRTGKPRGGAALDKCRLHALLTNATYIGLVRHHDQVFDGEHEAIISKDVWDRVQLRLEQQRRSGGGHVARNTSGALLKGLVQCAHCGGAMAHSFTTRGTTRYRYYTCLAAQKRGWQACPTKSVPAGDLERFVVQEIKCIGRDPTVVASTFAAANAAVRGRLTEIDHERTILSRELRRHHAAVKRTGDAAHLGDLHQQIHAANRRVAALGDEEAALRETTVSEREVAAALAEFDTMWSVLSPREQARVLHLLVERVVVDRVENTCRITFNPTGIRALGGGDDAIAIATADAA
ncbi:MAG: recombinase family protein [Phycisphaeraceae bacterium]|nr:recombinase family protein [Phycisphaerales bacterium]QOJ18537.1 MAG: recombinase family protein [Phycisphaeraceae bacterium]